MRVFRWIMVWWIAGIATGAVVGVLWAGSNDPWWGSAVIGGGAGALIALPIATITAVVRDIRARNRITPDSA